MSDGMPAYVVQRSGRTATRLRAQITAIDKQIAKYDAALKRLDEAMESGLAETDRRAELHDRLDTLAAPGRRRR